MDLRHQIKSKLGNIGITIIIQNPYILESPHHLETSKLFITHWYSDLVITCSSTIAPVIVII